VSYDINGDGTTDQTVQGVSNFFGLNDLLVTNAPNPIMDSAVQQSNFATTSSRTLSLFDNAGQIGDTMTIPTGSSLQSIANTINNYTQTNESTLQNGSSFTLTSAATVTVSDANGSIVSKSVGPGTVTLAQLATTLTSGTVTGSVVQENTSPAQSRLRFVDSRGVPLTVSITGGTISGQVTLGSQLNMTQEHRVRAEVVPDGAGYRLRVVQSDGQQITAAATQDAAGHSILTDLGLSAAATDTAASLSVRSDILSNPQKMSRGTLQWNATLNQYFMSPGDNTSALAFTAAMNATYSTPSAGNIAAGSYTLSGYASSVVSLVASASANAQSQYTQQSTLLSSLNTQYSSSAGVNIDQEVTDMISYQQAYSASARVISVMQEMLTTLTDLVK
jgi:flagellar hook-associated protein 1 FlgK